MGITREECLSERSRLLFRWKEDEDGGYRELKRRESRLKSLPDGKNKKQSLNLLKGDYFYFGNNLLISSYIYLYQVIIHGHESTDRFT